MPVTFSPAGWWNSSTLKHKFYFSGITKHLFISLVSLVALRPYGKLCYLSHLTSVPIDWLGLTLVTSHFKDFAVLNFPDGLAFWLRAASCRTETVDNFSWMNIQALPSKLTPKFISSPVSSLKSFLPPHPLPSFKWKLLPNLRWNNKEFRVREPGLKSSLFDLPTVYT